MWLSGYGRVVIIGTNNTLSPYIHTLTADLYAYTLFYISAPSGRTLSVWAVSLYTPTCNSVCNIYLIYLHACPADRVSIIYSAPPNVCTIITKRARRNPRAVHKPTSYIIIIIAAAASSELIILSFSWRTATHGYIDTL